MASTSSGVDHVPVSPASGFSGWSAVFNGSVPADATLPDGLLLPADVGFSSAGRSLDLLSLKEELLLIDFLN